MPGFLLHGGATVMCTHAGPATIVPSQPRVLVSGMPVALISDQIVVAGCEAAALCDGQMADALGPGHDQWPARHGDRRARHGARPVSKRGADSPGTTHRQRCAIPRYRDVTDKSDDHPIRFPVSF